jgi:predicted hotdog family 3-hydroxylacyl-ACP dehydratase
MLGREGIAALIPHQGEMCLLEQVIEWEKDRIVLATSTHRSPSNPLRLNGRLRAIHLCEYGAQAMAVHGGLVAQAEGRVAQPGFLVSLRDVRLEIDFIEALAADLRVTAQRLLETPASWQYAFTIEHEGKTLATGRAAVVARPSR